MGRFPEERAVGLPGMESAQSTSRRAGVGSFFGALDRFLELSFQQVSFVLSAKTDCWKSDSRRIPGRAWPGRFFEVWNIWRALAVWASPAVTGIHLQDSPAAGAADVERLVGLLRHTAMKQQSACRIRRIHQRYIWCRDRSLRTS